MTMTAPCPSCPFRTDVTPFIRPQRAKEITQALLADHSFQCHKTVDYAKAAEEDGFVHSIIAAREHNAQHCAGALIMLEKMERPNQWMRICERVGGYDRRKLDMDAPVYANADAMVRAHQVEWRKLLKKKA